MTIGLTQMTIKGLGAGEMQFLAPLEIKNSAGEVIFSIDSEGAVTAASAVTANSVVDGSGAVSFASTLAVAGASALHAVTATTVAASGLITSTVADGSPILKCALSTDTPTVAFGADASHNPSTAPAGYLEILVGSTPYYIPVWA